MGLSADELGIILLSLKVALVSVAFSLPVAIGVAYALARFDFPGKMLVDAVVHLPLVLPPVVVGFALLVLFGRHGPIGAWLESIACLFVEGVLLIICSVAALFLLQGICIVVVPALCALAVAHFTLGHLLQERNECLLVFHV